MMKKTRACVKATKETCGNSDFKITTDGHGQTQMNLRKLSFYTVVFLPLYLLAYSHIDLISI
jgi:hypothetical protein